MSFHFLERQSKYVGIKQKIDATMAINMFHHVKERLLGNNIVNENHRHQ